MESREFEPVICWMCGDRADWLVRDETGDELLACEKHKTTAFS